ncbi:MULTISPECIES: hypothetical protein [unclassified Allomuricauda]|uniref:hypothetical protein n=1 Tax=unclassified Allomuricauda TaxID=2615049 RepID=UPI00273EC6F5|nr:MULTISPECIES: hypothetical protein [unclassified Allomuricauda]
MNPNNRQRITKIGNMLLEGPLSIIHKASGDWLKKDFQLILHQPKSGTLKSYSIWSDDTWNKEADFLSPMIRTVIWDRQKDMEHLRKSEDLNFPSIDVALGTIKTEKFKGLNETFIKLQHLIITRPGYIPFRISTERDAPLLNVKADKEFLHYSLYFNNGGQTFELKSSGNLDQPLVVDLMDIATQLSESMQLIDPSPWKERYTGITKASLDDDGLDWDYQHRF